jgi:outer membrane receptor protein involved in Fe transport
MDLNSAGFYQKIFGVGKRNISLFFSLIFLLFYSPDCFSQNLSLQGTIEDTATNEKIKNAVVIAARLNDSILVSYTRSKTDGSFKLEKLPVDTYQVIISHPGLGDKILFILGNNTDTLLDFKKIILPPKSVNLQEVEIYGYTDPVYYKGDTLVFTADSFKVKQNAVVEDLLKKLPGVKVDQQGKIFVEGKAVDQVLVDGDEFFGSDPTVATKNLNANTVETVQVYDKKNENASTGDENETLKVMDLKLKEEAKKGYFGKVSAAGDFRKFYEGELLLNKFKGKQKISVFALGSNTPKSAFGWDDMWKYGLNNEMNFQTTDDGTTYYYGNNDHAKGIPKTFKSGIYFTDKIFEKTKLSFNYSYNKADLNSETNTASQYFFPDTSYNTNQVYNSTQSAQNNNFNVTVNQTIDSLTELELQNKTKYITNDLLKSESNSFLTNTNTLTRKTSLTNTNNGKTYDITGSARLTRNFKLKEKRLVFYYLYNIVDNKIAGTLHSFNTFFTDSIFAADSTDQQKTIASKTQKHFGNAIFTQPLSKKTRLEFSYDFTFIKGVQDKKTFDFDEGNYNLLNDSLTNNFETQKTINRFGTRFIYELKKLFLSVGSNIRQVNNSNKNLKTGQEISQEIKNLLPNASFRYKFSDNTSLRINYSTNSRQPDLNQLQPVPDNSNPNYILLGNPGLVPTYTHSFQTNFNSYKPVTGKNVWVGFNLSFTDNDISNSVTYDSIGRTISQAVNVQGNYRSSGYLNMSFPFFSKVLEINPGADLNFSRTTNFINKEKNSTKNSSVRGSLDATVQKEKFEISFGGNYAYSFSSSSISTTGNVPYHETGLNASAEFELPDKFKITSEANYTFQQQRTEGYNLKYLVWNASLSKTFLKNENLVLSVSATDILNENINTYRNVQDNVISDVRTTITGRYILLKALYKFNSNKTKDDEGED